MPRRLRDRVPGGTVHVYARGNRRQEIFRADVDYGLYLGLLGRTLGRHEVCCRSYCLMPNHVHLVLQSASGDLSRPLQWLHGTYASYFNERYGLDGHLFQGRFGSELVTTTPHLLELVRYLALNPWRAGLCAHPAEWKWGSYGAVVGARRGPRWLDVDGILELFGSTPANARVALAAFVRDGQALTLAAAA